MARKRRKKARKSRWPTLGLGAAALALTGLYQAGRREQRRAGRKAPPDLAGDPVLGVEPEEGPPEGAADLAGAERLEIRGPQGRLAAWALGAGPPAVVFVHGLGGSARQWSEQLVAFAPSARVAAFDLRGHGASEPAANGDYSLEALADDLLAIADALSLEGFVVVGHSLGAAVAIVAASRRPERVAGLFLVDPSGDQSRLPEADRSRLVAAVSADPHGELAVQFRSLLGGSPASAAGPVLADLAGADGKALAGALASIVETPLAERLAAFAGPKAALVSPFNQLPISLHRLDGSLPAEHLPGAGHWPMLERPAAVTAALEAFLARI